MSDTTSTVPIKPQWSFLKLGPSQWTAIATWLLLGPIGIYYKALAAKYNLPVPDAGTLGAFMMEYAPMLAGAAVAVYHRIESKVVTEAARILAARNAPETAATVAKAASDIKATGTTGETVS
jgi:hypothetical protein